MNRTYLYNIILSAAALAFSLQSTAAQSLKFPQSEASTIGLVVMNLDTGRCTVSINGDQAMIPASTMKCVTAASVLTDLGPDYRFVTPVSYTGRLADGIISGNLVVAASADPTVNSAHFPSAPNLTDEILSELQRRGVRQIKGDVIVDDSSFADPGLNPQWTVGDAAESYGTGLYGFNYSDNTFRYYPASGTSRPDQPYLDVTLEPSTSSVSVVHGVNSDAYLITGKGLDKASTMIELPMNNPALAYADNLRASLAAKGITVSGEDVDEGTSTLLLTHRSPTGLEILTSLVQRSDNMMAEGMLRALSPSGTRQQALARQRDVIQSIGVATHLTKIVDGSGLARMDRLTPMFLARLLRAMASSARGADYVAMFPKVGREGTVKNFLKGTRLAGRLALKSGSINGVHCYAGYRFDTSGHPTDAVVVMVNNFFCSRDAVRNAIADWLLEQLK